MLAAARPRPGGPARGAGAGGPPPDQPRVRNSAPPRASSPAATSPAASATRRPGSGVEPPYPGRLYCTSRRPRSAAALATNDGAASSPAGVPSCSRTVRASGGPVARTSGGRPAAGTVTFTAGIAGIKRPTGPRPPRLGRGGRQAIRAFRAARASTGYQVLCSHVTLNALPPVSADTESLARPLAFTMMILVGLALPIAAPFTIALLK